MLPKLWRVVSHHFRVPVVQTWGACPTHGLSSTLSGDSLFGLTELRSCVPTSGLVSCDWGGWWGDRVVSNNMLPGASGPSQDSGLEEEQWGQLRIAGLEAEETPPPPPPPPHTHTHSH